MGLKVFEHGVSDFFLFEWVVCAAFFFTTMPNVFHAYALVSIWNGASFFIIMRHKSIMGL